MVVRRGTRRGKSDESFWGLYWVNQSLSEVS